MACSKRVHGPIRCTRNRRKQQVQRLTNEEIQVLKTLVAILQEEMDFDRNSGTERPFGPVWTDVYIRLGKKLGKIHYPLSETVLRTKRLRGLQLDSSIGRVPKDNRANFSSDPPTKFRRI